VFVSRVQAAAVYVLGMAQRPALGSAVADRLAALGVCGQSFRASPQCVPSVFWREVLFTNWEPGCLHFRQSEELEMTEKFWLCSESEMPAKLKVVRELLVAGFPRLYL